MIILAHRGLWKSKDKRNSITALQAAFAAGFGIETDIRDYCGALVISHDIGSKDSPSLERVLVAYQAAGARAPLALNVKADGIQKLLSEQLRKYGIDNYFMFDMSVPEQVVYIKEVFHTFGRQSEFEQAVPMYKNVEGVWMDEFSQPWITDEIIAEHLRCGKRVGIISSEIHGNSADRLWGMLEQFRDDQRLMLCTDMPLKAKEYFYEKDKGNSV